MFRILQEALQNALKHSGVRHFRVELEGHPGGIQLTVSDLGLGFDPYSSASQKGLGLVSMRERAQMAGGEFVIKSQHGGGTIVSVRVPVEERQSSIAA
jgi:signal transduction histidine kinase